MRFLLASLLLTLGTSQAVAHCHLRSATVLTCTIDQGARQLEICLDGEEVIYRFGPPDAPGLTLSAPITEVAHQPWPGIGRAIWESTTFRNGAFTYEVHGSFDKLDQVSDGGVTVRENGREIASLSCDRGTTELGLFAISDAKEAAGQCWDIDAQRWGGC